MDSLQITTAQIARQILGQTRFLVRFQRQVAAPAFNHQHVDAEYRLVTLQDNRLMAGSQVGRKLSASDVSEFLSMTQDFEAAEFWKQYAIKYDLPEGYTNTDPVILCWPAQSLLDGKTTDQQDADFVRRFVN